MDAVIDWIEKSSNLKSLRIFVTFVRGRNADGGRDIGIRFAKTRTAKNTIESLELSRTDLMGSRNVDEWSEAFEKMTSLKCLDCRGMRRYIENVDESTFDEKTSTVTVPYRGDQSSFDKKTSRVKYPFDERLRIYWKR